MKISTPIWKIIATAGGTALTGAAIIMNAQHVAAADGWDSPLVWAAIIVTACAAVTPPFAERCSKDGQPAKAALLWLFFSLAVGFSLTASIARTSSYSESRSASVEQTNAKAKLAREAYEQATAARDAECASGRGPKCKGLEDRADQLRSELATASPVQSADPGAERLAAVLGVGQDAVALYVPLLLPLGLELGGFIFLAAGLAPARRRRETGETVEKLMREAGAKPRKPAKAGGTREYYLGRLEREFPAIAARVYSGEISVYRACIDAGLRKAPKKSTKWTKVDSYIKADLVNA